MLQRLGRIALETVKTAVLYIPSALLFIPLGLTGVISDGGGHTAGLAFGFCILAAATAAAVLGIGFVVSLFLNLFGIPWFITLGLIYTGFSIWIAMGIVKK